MTKDEEIARLRQLLAKRTGQLGWSANVKAIESRIAKLEKANGE